MTRPGRFGLLLALFAIALAPSRADRPVPGPAGAPGPSRPPYPWPAEAAGGPLAERFAPPPGFARLAAAPGSFAAWFRGLPLRQGRPPVRLHDGTPKANQEAHEAVLSIDVGAKDLQQCADAVIRLRAEYLYAAGCDEAIAFRFTSGDVASWTAWRDGERPRVEGRRVSWARAAPPDGGYRSFRDYLDAVFTYAGSISLARDLEPVPDPAALEPGDVFVQGGSPGHAVLVVDVVVGEGGARRFLLAQSYMPAQEIHVLRNPDDPGSPWFAARRSGPLRTPEWSFRHEDLRRFPPAACEPAEREAP